jgi:hypothetical protein
LRYGHGELRVDLADVIKVGAGGRLNGLNLNVNLFVCATTRRIKTGSLFGGRGKRHKAIQTPTGLPPAGSSSAAASVISFLWFWLGLPNVELGPTRYEHRIRMSV